MASRRSASPPAAPKRAGSNASRKTPWSSGPGSADTAPAPETTPASASTSSASAKPLAPPSGCSRPPRIHSSGTGSPASWSTRTLPNAATLVARSMTRCGGARPRDPGRRAGSSRAAPRARPGGATVCSAPESLANASSDDAVSAGAIRVVREAPAVPRATHRDGGDAVLERALGGEVGRDACRRPGRARCGRRPSASSPRRARPRRCADGTIVPSAPALRVLHEAAQAVRRDDRPPPRARAARPRARRRPRLAPMRSATSRAKRRARDVAVDRSCRVDFRPRPHGARGGALDFVPDATEYRTPVARQPHRPHAERRGLPQRHLCAGPRRRAGRHPGDRLRARHRGAVGDGDAAPAGRPRPRRVPARQRRAADALGHPRRAAPGAPPRRHRDASSRRRSASPPRRRPRRRARSSTISATAWSRASARSWARRPARGAAASARCPTRNRQARGRHCAWGWAASCPRRPAPSHGRA